MLIEHFLGIIWVFHDRKQQGGGVVPVYNLMNGDIITASFDKENNRWNVLHQYSELPLGRFEINRWLEDGFPDGGGRYG